MAVVKATAKADIARVQAEQVVSMFRKFCRNIPKILVMYNLEQTPAEARHMLLLQFRKASASTPNDPRVIEMMLERARQEFEETMQQWKQKGHLMAILQPEVAAPDVWLNEEEFFRRFLEGTVDEEVVWANWDAKKMQERVARLKSMERQAGMSEEEAEVEALLKGLQQGSRMQ